MKIKVLGTEYEIVRPTPEQDKALKEIDGYCDNSVYKIVVSSETPNDATTKANLELVRKRQLRHEIIHAFLSESGLAENSEWAMNEEIVDFFALQIPKMVQTMKEAGAFDA